MEIFTAKPPWNGRGVSRIKTGDQREYCPCGKFRKQGCLIVLRDLDLLTIGMVNDMFAEYRNILSLY